MLFFLAVYVGPIVVAGVSLALLYFMKSSKEMPKNWDEFLTEAWFQYHGIRGLAEDKLNSRYNVVGECTFTFHFPSQRVHFFIQNPSQVD